MKAIIYTSNTGSTAEYAQLLGKELNLPVHSLQKAKNKVPAGSEINYLGWIMAGGIKGYNEAAKLYKVRAICGIGMGQVNGGKKDKLSDKSKSVASKVVNAIVAKLEKASQALLGNIISALNEPKNKVKAKEQIKEQARVSIQAKLKEKQKQVMEYEKKQDVHIRKKNMEL